MKKGILWWGVILMGFSHAMAQRAGVATNLSLSVTNFLPIRLEYDQQAEKGPHHHRVTHVKQSVNSFGQILSETNSYVELATGMHYRDEKGEWQSTEERIELINGMAVARKGPHKVIFNPNPNVIGAVDLETPDGKRLRSHVLGLSLYDPVTGHGETIATLKDVTGELVAANQILYPDAFEGVKADLRYTYTASGLEQDVILREQIDLADYDIGTARLEVVTEFDEMPAVAKVPEVLRRETDPTVRQAAAEPDLVDEQLKFGAMQIGEGRAFDLNNGINLPNDQAARVTKRFDVIEGRNILFEAVELNDVAQQLEKLPAGKPRASVDDRNKNRKTVWIKPIRQLPASLMNRKVAARAAAKPLQLARADYANKPGLVVDYTIVNTTADFTFKGDMTYFVTNNVTLSGTIILEGGAVIKYNTSTAPQINVTGTFVCKTDNYRPAFLTGIDDNTIGGTVTGSTGSPLFSNYGSFGFYFNTGAGNVSISNIIARYVRTPLAINVTGTHIVANCQIFEAEKGISLNNSTVNVRNCLLDHLSKAFSHGSGTLRGENITIHRADYLKEEPYGPQAAYLTNCLSIGVTNYPGASSVEFYNSYTNSADTGGIFQTVGGGQHYLANASPYRNCGTTNVNSTLLSALRSKTTYPPVTLSNTTISVDTTLAPQAQRDVDEIDLGYHYDPLDYLVSGVSVINASLLLTNGVAVGAFGNYGIFLRGGAKVVAHGRANNLNRIIWHRSAQECYIYSDVLDPYILCFYSEVPEPELTLDFTLCSPAPGGSGGYTVYPSVFNPMTVRLTNCQLYNGVLFVFNWTTNANVFLHNCLFDRANAVFHGADVECYNCTFIEQATTFSSDPSETYVIKDNLFDRCVFGSGTTGTWSVDCNAYVTNYNTLATIGAHDVTLAASPAYETSYLGCYYLPSSSALINAGSRTSANAGLYHHTTLASQAKEGAGTVDIGFHYVATDGNGMPLDTDGDGLPDYIEDRNGNGSVDSGETNWNSATDLGLNVFITQPQPGSLLP